MYDNSLSATRTKVSTKENGRLGKTMPIVVFLFAVLFVGPVEGQSEKWQKLMAVGNSQVKQGLQIEAEKTFREALVIAEKADRKYLSLPTTLINLALVCKAQAKNDEAYSLANRAVLELSNATNSFKNLKLNNPSADEYYKVEITATALDYAADIYSAQKKYEEAEPVLKLLVTIREGAARTKKPKNNEDFLAAMAQAATGALDKLFAAYENLARVYFVQGKNAEAEALYKNALKYSEENQENGPSTAARVHIMFGGLYFKQDKYAEAEASIEKALKIYQEKRAKPDGYSAVALSKLATLYLKQEKYFDNARSYFQQALNIFQKEGWKDQPEIADALENYATLLRKLGNEAEAVEMASRAKAIRDKHTQSNQVQQ